MELRPVHSSNISIENDCFEKYLKIIKVPSSYSNRNKFLRDISTIVTNIEKLEEAFKAHFVELVKNCSKTTSAKFEYNFTLQDLGSMHNVEWEFLEEVKNNNRNLSCYIHSMLEQIFIAPMNKRLAPQFTIHPALPKCVDVGIEVIDYNPKYRVENIRVEIKLELMQACTG